MRSPSDHHRSGLPLLALLFVAMASSAWPLSIRDVVGELKLRGTATVAGREICAAGPLTDFYERRGLAPAWSVRRRLEPNARALLTAISRSHEDGLVPEQYHLEAIRRLSSEPARIEELDLLLTDAFLLLSSHLLSGTVEPESLMSTWCLQPRGADLVGALETALENRMVAETLATMAPHHDGYRRLREALHGMRSGARSNPWPVVTSGAPMRSGDSGERVTELINRLIASGDLSGRHGSFDESVDLAVRRFQRLHRIDEDGIVGARTLHELNVPIDARTRQIELNLERWRWLPSSLGSSYLLVNIPEFALRVVENERNVLSMRIIVGTEYRRTPVFSAKMNQIVFSPYWNVPDRIAREELWPKINRDRSYLASEHLEITPEGRLRQTPGPWNALGRLKFLFPNPYEVYLHDTPARQLFSESKRAFSHGCMRIERPVDLAAWLLRNDPDWTRERIVEQSQTGRETTVRLAAPVDVHVLYWTAFVSEGGELHFVPDIYGQDERLATAIDARRR